MNLRFLKFKVGWVAENLQFCENWVVLRNQNHNASTKLSKFGKTINGLSAKVSFSCGLSHI